jgi:undecaprenyl-diphosphatase
LNLFYAFILGIIQGLTEFIPVSSTAHLLITGYFLNIPQDDPGVFAFNVLVQLGTTLALIIYFWQDLFTLFKAFFATPFSTAENRLAWYILIATIPALLAGVLLKKLVADLFSVPLTAAAIRLFAAAILLVLAEWFGKRTRTLESMKWPDALFIGLMQVISVFPGASRSGTTISGGMFLGFDRPTAARFAFLMSVPVLLAAGGYETLDLLRHGSGLGSFLLPLAVGFIAAGIVGWMSIKWLLSYLNKHSLYVFAMYCAALGLVCVAFS